MVGRGGVDEGGFAFVFRFFFLLFFELLVRRENAREAWQRRIRDVSGWPRIDGSLRKHTAVFLG